MIELDFEKNKEQALTVLTHNTYKFIDAIRGYDVKTNAHEDIIKLLLAIDCNINFLFSVISHFKLDNSTITVSQYKEILENPINIPAEPPTFEATAKLTSGYITAETICMTMQSLLHSWKDTSLHCMKLLELFNKLELTTMDFFTRHGLELLPIRN